MTDEEFKKPAERPALQDDAPAKALEDAADWFNLPPNGAAYNGYKVTEILRKRAASIRAAMPAPVRAERPQLSAEQVRKVWRAAIEHAIHRTMKGRVMANFHHVPSVVRALEWLWADLQDSLDTPPDALLTGVAEKSEPRCQWESDDQEPPYQRQCILKRGHAGTKHIYEEPQLSVGQVQFCMKQSTFGELEKALELVGGKFSVRYFTEQLNTAFAKEIAAIPPTESDEYCEKHRKRREFLVANTTFVVTCPTCAIVEAVQGAFKEVVQYLEQAPAGTRHGHIQAVRALAETSLSKDS